MLLLYIQELLWVLGTFDHTEVEVIWKKQMTMQSFAHEGFVPFQISVHSLGFQVSLSDPSTVVLILFSQTH